MKKIVVSIIFLFVVAIGLIANNPPTHFNAVFSQNHGRIEFTWREPSGNQSGNPSGYEIYRNGDLNNPIAWIPGWQNTSRNVPIETTWLNVENSFQLAAIYPTHPIRVLASAIHTFRIDANPPGDPILDFAANGGVRIRWAAPLNTGPHSLRLEVYDVFRDGQRIAPSPVNGALEFIDRNVVTGIEYEYHIVAVFKLILQFGRLTSFTWQH
jgi:hypothetical protein